MKRVPIRSSVIRSAGFDSSTGTLEIEFVTRLIYQYQRVPRVRFKSLIEASSKGRYFNANIRDKYPYVQLEA